MLTSIDGSSTPVLRTYSEDPGKYAHDRSNHLGSVLIFLNYSIRCLCGIVLKVIIFKPQIIILFSVVLNDKLSDVSFKLGMVSECSNVQYRYIECTWYGK